MGRSILPSEAIDGQLQSTLATRAHAKRMRTEQNWCCEHAQQADSCQACAPSKIHVRIPPTATRPCPGQAAYRASAGIAAEAEGEPATGVPTSTAQRHAYLALLRERALEERRTRNNRIRELEERRNIALEERRTLELELVQEDAAFTELAEHSLAAIRARAARNAPAFERDTAFADLVERSLVDIRAQAARRAPASPPPLNYESAGSPVIAQQDRRRTPVHDARIQRLLDAHIDQRRLPAPSSSREITIDSESAFRSETPPSDEVSILRTNLRTSHADSTPRTTTLSPTSASRAFRLAHSPLTGNWAEDFPSFGSETPAPEALVASSSADSGRIQQRDEPRLYRTGADEFSRLLNNGGPPRWTPAGRDQYGEESLEALFARDVDDSRDPSPGSSTSLGADVTVGAVPASARSPVRRHYARTALARARPSTGATTTATAGEERSSTLGTTAPAAHSSVAWNFPRPYQPPAGSGAYFTGSLPSLQDLAAVRPDDHLHPPPHPYRNATTTTAAAGAAERWQRAIDDVPTQTMPDLSAVESILDGLETLSPEQSGAVLRALADRVRRTVDDERVAPAPSRAARRVRDWGSIQEYHRSRGGESGGAVNPYVAAGALPNSAPAARMSAGMTPRTLPAGWGTARDEEAPVQEQQGRAYGFSSREAVRRLMPAASPSSLNPSSAEGAGGRGRVEQQQEGRTRARALSPLVPCPVILHLGQDAGTQMQVDNASSSSPGSSSASSSSTLPSRASSSRDALSTSTSSATAAPSPPPTHQHRDRDHDNNLTRLRIADEDCPVEDEEMWRTAVAASGSGSGVDHLRRLTGGSA